LLVSLVTGGQYARAKGLAEAVIARLGIGVGPAVGNAPAVEFRRAPFPLFTAGRSAELLFVEPGQRTQRIGVVGEIAATVLGRFGLESPIAAAELRLDRLWGAVGRERRLVAPSEFPAVQRDVNLVVDAAVTWADLERAIRGTAGTLAWLEEIRLVQIWEDEERLGQGKKSVVVGVRLRSHSGTISSDESKRLIDGIVAACHRECGAVLRG
jgi:phenylalanyl-tRNA synthetase beta chain